MTLMSLARYEQQLKWVALGPGILALWLLLSLFGSTACTMLRRRRSRRRARRKRPTRAGI